MWQRFTTGAKAWVYYAQCEAGRFGIYAVSPEHFLLALLREGGDDPALALLKQIGVDVETLQTCIESQMACALNGTQTWPPRPKEEGYANDVSAPVSIPINEENLGKFALDAYSMHLMTLIRAEAARRDSEEISSLYVLLGLIRQDEIRQDEAMAIRLFQGTEITLQSAREAVAKLEGYEAAPTVPQKPGLWSRLFGKHKAFPD